MLLKYAFEVLGVRRVQIKTDHRNEKAQHAIERLGAVKEGILRNERTLYDGYTRNAVLYSIIDEEWNSVKEKLESYIYKGRKVVIHSHGNEGILDIIKYTFRKYFKVLEL